MTQCIWPVNHCPSIIARNWVQVLPQVSQTSGDACNVSARPIPMVEKASHKTAWLEYNAEKEKSYLPKLGNGYNYWQNILSTDFTFINCFEEKTRLSWSKVARGNVKNVLSWQKGWQRTGWSRDSGLELHLKYWPEQQVTSLGRYSLFLCLSCFSIWF